MSLYYPMSPVHRKCPTCDGFGLLPLATHVGSCPACNGIGRIWLEGGPSFGCKMTLATRKRGEIVTLGNGDRGRVIRHSKRGPTTALLLIDDMFGQEAEEATEYPSETGVRSTMPALAVNDDHAGQERAKHDHVDPLQREKAL